MDRKDVIAAFIARSGWGGAAMRTVAGDASNRRYFRLTRPAGETAILMDAPPERGDDVRPFVAVARHLSGLGLSAPAILSGDEGAGLLLLEDLGDDLYARLVARDPSCEAPLYEAAVDCLGELHRHVPPSWATAYDDVLMTDRALLALTWYRKGITGDDGDTAAFASAMGDALQEIGSIRPVLALRDFHAENLLWLPARHGAARVGLLDFQDAQAAHPAYDLVSLLEDARRDVSPDLAARLMQRYIDQTGVDGDAFRYAAACLSAQRNLRILGVFARLSMHYGKPHYVDLIPRVWRHLEGDLSDPGLAGLRGIADRLLPEPTPANLQRLKDLCATVPTA